jgi:hypothetical protein
MIDIKGLVQSRVSQYDPTLNVSEGSAFYNAVIRPLEAVFAQDPLQTDVRSFLKAKLAEAYPDLPVSEGDALNDVLINAVSLFFEGYRAELQNISRRQSISNVGTLADEDVDDLAANWLVSRRLGGNAQSVVRIVVSSASPIEVNQSIIFSTASGVAFSPDGVFSISTQELMQRQLSTRQYYYDIPVVAVSPGASGNVSVGEISSALNINNLVSVSNTVAGSGGRDPESSDTLVRSRLSNAVSERSLVTARGALAQILTESPDVLGAYIAGMGDPNLERDRVITDGVGPLLGSGVAIFDETRTTVFLLTSPLQSQISSTDVLGISLLAVDTFEPQYSAHLALQSVLAQTRLGAVTLSVVKVSSDETLSRSDAGLLLACTCSIYAPVSVRIDGETLEAGTSIGGRSDIHVDPAEDSLVSEIVSAGGSDLLCTGTDIVSDGSTNTVTLGDLPEGIETSDLYLAVVGVPGLYKVLYQDRVDGHTRITLDRVFPFVTPEGTGVRWKVYRRSAVYHGDIVHAPLEGAQLDVSGLIGTNRIYYASTHALSSLGLPLSGLTLVVLAETQFELPIESIGGFIQTLLPLPMTLSRVPARIVEAVQQIPLPMSHISSLTSNGAQLPRSEALGLRVTSITPPRVTQSGLVGHVSPKLHYAFGSSRLVSQNEEALPLLRTFSMDADSYVALAEGGSVSPYELGTSIPRAGSCAVRVAIPRSGGTVDYIDVTLPTDLFCPGRYNVFVGVGNLTYERLIPLIEDGFSDRDLAPFPLNMERPVNAARGDLLEVTGMGTFVVDEVYDVDIPVGPLRTSLQLGMNEGVYPAYGIDRSCVLRLSVVRVYGEFDMPSVALLEPDMRLPAAPVSLSGSTAISVDALLRCLMSPDLLAEGTEQTQQGVSAALERRVGISYPTGSLARLPSLLMGRDAVSYRVGKSGVGTGELLFQDSGSPEVYLPRVDYISHGQVNAVLAAVRAGEVVAATQPAPTFSTASRGGLGIYIDPDPSEKAVLGEGRDQVPTEWARDFSYDPGSSGEGIRLLRSTAIDSSSLLALGVDQEDYGYDVVEVPDRFGPIGLSVDVRLGDELRVLPEALFTEHASFEIVGGFLGYLVSNTPSDGADLYVRGGVLLFEQQTPTRPASVSEADWNNVIRSEWLVRRTLIPAERWAYVRDLISAAQSEAGYPLLAALCEQGTLDNLKNVQGQTVVEWLTAVALRQPNSVLYTPTRAQLGTHTPPIQRAAEIFKRVVRNVSSRKLGLPTITTQRGSAVVSLNKVSPAEQSSVAELTQDLIGAYLMIEQGPDKGGYEIIALSSEQRTITLDRPMSSSTPPIEVYGVCGLSDQSVKITGYESAVDGVDSAFKFPTRTRVIDGDFSAVGSFPGYGVTSRSLTSRDVGKYMTLYNYGRDSVDGEAPTRQHFGSYLITNAVSETSYDASIGGLVSVSQTVRLAEFSPPSSDVERCFFVVSSEVIAPDVGELKGLRPIHVYETEPLTYPIIGAETDIVAGGGRRLSVVTQGGLIPSAVETRGPLTQRTLLRDQLNPAIVVRPGQATVELSRSLGIYRAPVRLKTLSLSESYAESVGQTYRTDIKMGGYSMRSADTALTFSSREVFSLEVPHTAVGAGELSVQSLYSSATYSVNTFINLSSNRIVCADLLARRMSPAFIGVRMTYIGSTSEAEMRSAIAEAVKNALTASGSLSASDLVALAYQRGATKVGQPIEMFYVVEGRDRRRHLEYISGNLTLGSITGFVGSIETTSIRAGTDPTLCMGVDISVTRVQSTAQLGG